MTRRFGQPDTSIKAFVRLITLGLSDLVVKMLLAGALIVAAISVVSGGLLGAFIVIVTYTGGLLATYLIWRYLMQKGTWWIS